MATIGLRDLYYAKLTTDPASGTATYEESVRIVGAISASVNPNTSTSTLFYDDGPGDTAATLGEITLELNVADLPLEVQAVLLGHSHEGGIMKAKAGDVPPWVAIGFRTLKSNGKYRYYWLNKGKFAIPEDSFNTKADSIEFQTPTISGSFVKRDSDDEWKRVADEDDEDFTEAMKAAWFLSPVGEIVAVTGVTLTPDTLALTAGGATGELTATVAPAGATNKSVTYVSSMPAVATVSATGVVTPLTAGSTTITVTTADGSFTDTCAVTVS